MDASNTVIPAIIDPLVARHATDAAFYWLQIDQSAASFQLTPARLRLFNSRLEAHLEGLSVAGREGLQPAFAALDRWKKPGEAFVCTWLAAQHPDDEPLNTLAAHLDAQPDGLLRGAISALARLPSTTAGELLHRWSRPHASPPLQVVALRAAALIGPDAIGALAAPLPKFIASPVAHVRAATCRVLARQAPEQAKSLLHDALADTDMAVRAEAAIALARMPDPGKAGAVLWQCLAAQVAVREQATGWYRMQATRRLNRWTRYLAWLAPLGHPDLPTLFDHLPPRAGLTFALYHGDGAHLGRVVAALKEPETARYAGWVWQTLTGLDLEAAGYALPESDTAPADGPVTDARLDADNGLPLPDPEAVARSGVTLAVGKRSLLGRELTVPDAAYLLSVAPQAVRSVAAHFLEMTVPNLAPNTRANARRQQAQMTALQDAIRT